MDLGPTSSRFRYRPKIRNLCPTISRYREPVGHPVLQVHGSVLLFDGMTVCSCGYSGAGWQLWPKIVGLSDSFEMKSDSFLAPRRRHACWPTVGESPNSPKKLKKSLKSPNNPKFALKSPKTPNKTQTNPKTLKVKPPGIDEMVFLLEKLVKELIA